MRQIIKKQQKKTKFIIKKIVKFCGIIKTAVSCYNII